MFRTINTYTVNARVLICMHSCKNLHAHPHAYIQNLQACVFKYADIERSITVATGAKGMDT